MSEQYPRPKNPPLPDGWSVVAPHETIPAEVVAWAKLIEHDPVTYPLPAPDGGRTTVIDVFGDQTWGARVEWHTWIGATGEQRPDGVRGTSVYHVADPEVIE